MPFPRRGDLSVEPGGTSPRFAQVFAQFLSKECTNLSEEVRVAIFMQGGKFGCEGHLPSLWADSLCTIRVITHYRRVNHARPVEAPGMPGELAPVYVDDGVH